MNDGGPGPFTPHKIRYAGGLRLEGRPESMDEMSEQFATQRIELSEPVRAILEANTSNSRLLGDYLRFLEAILAQDGARIDNVITSDARFHELEAMGLPPGPEGLKMFRQQVNGACPDEHISISNVRFEGDDILEADLDISGTHTGTAFMDIPAAGRKIRFGVGARNRFVDGRIAERWDVADFEDLRRQLTGPAAEA
jgi:predicted ester cyclase